ncbi:hypothetical protein VULLAG_LOCUS7876 [Vulpes lagopus]
MPDFRRPNTAPSRAHLRPRPAQSPPAPAGERRARPAPRPRPSLPRRHLAGPAPGPPCSVPPGRQVSRARPQRPAGPAPLPYASPAPPPGEQLQAPSPLILPTAR